MRWMPLLAAFGVAGITGCAAISLAGRSEPRTQLAHAAMALEKQDYARARELLEPVYYQHWDQSEGQQALLMLVAAELDGRNPDRRLWAAVDMSNRLLQIPTLQGWMVPLAESYYTVAVELGGTEQRVAVAEARANRAEQAAGTGRGRPETPRETVNDRVRRVEQEASRKIKELEGQVATLDKELKDTKQELERVKKTIKP